MERLQRSDRTRCLAHCGLGSRVCRCARCTRLQMFACWSVFLVTRVRSESGRLQSASTGHHTPGAISKHCITQVTERVALVSIM